MGNAPVLGKTPGLYSTPSATDKKYNTITFRTKILIDPGADANVFWAHQFTGGYVGTQTRAQGDKRYWLFSIWGATAGESNANLSGELVSNTDGSPGASVRIWWPWTLDTQYELTVSRINSREGWWNATVRDNGTREEAWIGNLNVGNNNPIMPESSWVEYWNWNDPSATCTQQAASAVVYGPITGDGGENKYASTHLSEACTNGLLTRILDDGSARLAAFPKAMNWDAECRTGKIGQVYAYDNPYNGKLELFRLAALGDDGKYWYFPIDEKDNEYWEYLDYKKPVRYDADVKRWGENDRKGTIGDVFIYSNPYTKIVEYFRLTGLGSDDRYWYFPTDQTNNQFWTFLGTDYPAS